MRSSILYAAPLLAVAYAQEDNLNTTTVLVESGTATVSSTFVYSNDFTSFLTQTNSLGVVTGQPEVATSQAALPPGVTTQPEVATIPAGLPVGQTVIQIGNGTALTSFTVDVQSSTTNVLGANAQPTEIEVETFTGDVATGTDAISISAAATTGSSDAESTGTSTTDSNDSDDADSTADSTTDSDSADSTSAADSDDSDSAAVGNAQLASMGVVSFGALAAFFL